MTMYGNECIFKRARRAAVNPRSTYHCGLDYLEVVSTATAPTSPLSWRIKQCKRTYDLPIAQYELTSMPKWREEGFKDAVMRVSWLYECCYHITLMQEEGGALSPAYPGGFEGMSSLCARVKRCRLPTGIVTFIEKIPGTSTTDYRLG